MSRLYVFVYVAEWPLFRRQLLIRLTVCSICIFIYYIFCFGFEGGTFFLIASVPGHCLSFTFETVIPSW